jgi:hypothetical protein
VTVLKLRTINFKDSARLARQRFGARFDDSRFSRAGGPEEQTVYYRTSNGSQSSQVRLVNIDNLLDRFVLTHDERAQILSSNFASVPVCVGSKVTLICAMAAPLFAAAFPERD